MEYRVRLKTVTSPEEVRLEDDPVRRGVDYHFRMTNGRRIFTIPDKLFVVCTANTFQLPTTMNELEKYSDSNAEEFTIFLQYGVMKRLWTINTELLVTITKY